MPRSRVVGMLWAALLVQTAVAQPAVAQPATTKPSVLVLPFAPAPGLEPSDRFLGVTLQNLFENALVEIPEIQETWFLQKVWASFSDLDQWDSFLLGKGPALDFSSFTCVVSGDVGRNAAGYLLKLRIGRKVGAATASLAVDFPALVEVRRAFVNELRTAGCSPVDASPLALWEEQLTAASAAVMGRGLADYMAISIFGSEWNSADLAEAARLAPRSYLALDNLGWVEFQRGEPTESTEFEKALAVHRGIQAIEGLAHSRSEEEFAALLRERAERRRQFDSYAMGRALLYRARRAFAQEPAIGAAAFTKALAAVREAKDRAGEASALNGSGAVHVRQKEFDQALALLEQSLAVRREIHDRNGENQTLLNLGLLYANQRQYPKAVEYFDQRLALRRQVKDRPGEIAALDGLALVAGESSQTDRAIVYLEQALGIAREVRNRAAESDQLDSLGLAYGQSGRYEKAVDAYNQNLAIRRELKDRAGEGNTLHNLGWVYHQSARYEHAIGYFLKALAVKRELQDRSGEGSEVYSLGWAYDQSGRCEQAMGYYEQAVGIQRELKDRKTEGQTLEYLGTCYGKTSQFEKAIATYEQALEVRRELKDRPGEGTELYNLGWVNRLSGSYEQSISHYEQAIALYRELKDPVREQASLLSVAITCSEAGQYDRAIGYSKQALVIQRELKDAPGQEGTLGTLSEYERRVGRYDEAIQHLEQKWALSRDLNDRPGEAAALEQLGGIYSDRDEIEPALRYLQQALTLARAASDRRVEAMALNLIGFIESHNLRQYEKGLTDYEHALAIEREIKDREQEGHTLHNLGNYYAEIGLRQKATGYIEEALPIERETRDRFSESMSLLYLGDASSRARQFDKAAQYYKQALLITRQGKYGKLEAAALTSLGDLSRDLKQFDEALSYLGQALRLDQALGEMAGVGIALLHTGMTYQDMHLYEQEIIALEQALAIFRNQQDRYPEACTLINLSEAHDSLKHPQLAIVYAKLGVNELQTIREDNRLLRSELRKSLDSWYKPFYQWLAMLLIRDGRLSEALLVLDLLKQKEVLEYMRGGAPQPGQAGQIPLGKEELRAVSLINSSVEFNALSAKPARTPDDLSRLRVLTGELQAGNRTFRQQLDALFMGAAKRAIDPSAVKEHVGALQNMLQKLGMPAVAVYTLLGDEQISLIVVTPQSASYESSTAGREQVLELIAAFQQKLRNPRSDPLPEAQALYKLIFAPVRPLIEAAQAKVIYWQLNGQLRYIPIAALHDGRSYVAEQFQNVLLNIGNQTSLNEPSNPQWTGYGFGVTEGHPGFSPLPFVGDELHRIIAESPSANASAPPLPGKIMLDSQFTREAFEQQMFDRRPVVHIASHFRFDPTDGNRSYLLLGDGSSLSVNDLADMTNLFQNVDLVTFSACETALGQQNADGQEVDALADVAIRKGAKAVLATLWPVNDRATGLLMAEFYRVHHQDKLTKSEALQRAQESMIRGEVGPQAGDATDRGVSPARRDPPSQLPKGFSHPYYWAPFILIGNLK